VAKECGVNFISVDGPELFTKWLGESEEGVRQVFRIARQVAPAVIFFDQLEAIAPIRGDHTGAMTTDRVVSQLLAELDGVQQLARVIILGATNRIDLIDPSILRPGRFGMHITVGLPTEADRVEILKICLKTKLLQPGKTLDGIATQIARLTDGYSGARLKLISDQAKRISIMRNGFTRVAEPTIDDVIVALEAEGRKAPKGESNHG
jgi:transitional endoplasmic reticulum ATPase